MKNWLKKHWRTFTLVLVAALLFVGYLFVSSHPILTSSSEDEDSCVDLLPQNPYTTEEIGKHTGFEWSVIDRGSGDCEAYNEPFVIGCMEHVRQEIQYGECIGDAAHVSAHEAVRPVLMKECSDSIGGYCMDDW